MDKYGIIKLHSRVILPSMCEDMKDSPEAYETAMKFLSGKAAYELGSGRIVPIDTSESIMQPGYLYNNNALLRYRKAKGFPTVGTIFVDPLKIVDSIHDWRTLGKALLQLERLIRNRNRVDTFQRLDAPPVVYDSALNLESKTAVEIFNLASSSAEDSEDIVLRGYFPPLFKSPKEQVIYSIFFYDGAETRVPAMEILKAVYGVDETGENDYYTESVFSLLNYIFENGEKYAAENDLRKQTLWRYNIMYALAALIDKTKIPPEEGEPETWIVSLREMGIEFEEGKLIKKNSP